jgi:hypothetical protein
MGLQRSLSETSQNYILMVSVIQEGSPQGARSELRNKGKDTPGESLKGRD